MNTASKHIAPRRAWKWPMIVVGILFTHTSTMILAVVLFVRHNDAVIPNYYEKAVHWDEIKAGRRHGEDDADAARNVLP